MSSSPLGSTRERKFQEHDRAAVTRKLMKDFRADFEQHGADAIASARKEDPVAYIRLAFSLLPKEVKVDVSVRTLSDEEIEQRILELTSIPGNIDPLPLNEREDPELRLLPTEYATSDD